MTTFENLTPDKSSDPVPVAQSVEAASLNLAHVRVRILSGTLSVDTAAIADQATAPEFRRHRRGRHTGVATNGR